VNRMMPANAENGDDRGVSSIPNLMRDRLSGAQANRRKSDDKKQQLDICDLDELMIYNQRLVGMIGRDLYLTVFTAEIENISLHVFASQLYQTEAGIRVLVE